MVDVPGSPRAHVWVGLVVAIVGIAMGGYAYTGPRAYRFEFIFLALVGFLLLAGGSLLTGYGQANRPRMGKPKRTRRKDGRTNPRKQPVEEEPVEDGPVEEEPDGGKDDEEQDAGTEADGAVPGGPAEETSWSQRLRAWIPGLGRSAEVQATVACPACQRVFETEGQVPFETTCPHCAHQGQVGEPQEVEMTASAAPVPSAGRSGEEITATLACSHCEHVFTATGTPPFRTKCPNCASTGRVDARSG